MVVVVICGSEVETQAEETPLLADDLDFLDEIQVSWDALVMMTTIIMVMMMVKVTMI